MSAASRAEPPPKSSVLIETAAPREQLLKRTTDAYGTVAIGEDAVVGISFLHAGQISDLRIRPGQVVNAGEVLLDLSADPSSTLSYQTAVATLEFARRDLARTTLSSHNISQPTRSSTLRKGCRRCDGRCRCPAEARQ